MAMLGIFLLLTSSLPGVLTSSKKVEVKVTRLDTLFMPPAALLPRGVNEVAFDADQKIFYSVGADFINIVSARNPENLTLLASVPYPVKGSLGLTIKVCGDRVYVGADISPSVSPRKGVVWVLTKFNNVTGNMDLLSTFAYGEFTYPRNIQLTSDCGQLFAALENFPDFRTFPGKTKDLAGEISMVSDPGSKYPKITNVGFQKFEDQFEELQKQGVRFVENDNTFAEDIEPSFITLSERTNKAYLVLQETNAIGVVNLETNELENVFGLGEKNWSHFLMDASSADGGIHLDRYPVFSFYQPDRVLAVEFQEEEYLVMANEGMSQLISRSATEEIRGANIPDDEIADSVPQSLRDLLKDDTKLGELRFSSVDGRNEEGKYERFIHFGGRSFSIRRAEDMSLVYDSGGDFEFFTAKLRPDIFNTRVRFSQTLLSTFDERSPFKGPEPEGLAVGYVDDVLLIFCSMERPGQVFVYSVEKDIRRPQFQTLYFEGAPYRSNRTIQDLFHDQLFFDMDPEDIQFFEAGVVAEYPVLSVGGGFPNTLTLLRVDVIKSEEKYVPPPDDAPISAFFGDAFRWLYTQTICKLIDVSGCRADDRFAKVKRI